MASLLHYLKWKEVGRDGWGKAREGEDGKRGPGSEYEEAEERGSWGSGSEENEYEAAEEKRRGSRSEENKLHVRCRKEQNHVKEIKRKDLIWGNMLKGNGKEDDKWERR